MTENKWAVIVHGGAGNYQPGIVEKSRPFLKKLCAQVKEFLFSKGTKEAVRLGVQALEDHPEYNAGTGSKIQADGISRLTASYMDSHKQKFSSIINITDIQNPINLACLLQDEPYPNIAGAQANELARRLNIPEYDPRTTQRIDEFHGKKEQDTGGHGTVGVCVMGPCGTLAVGTSTGGVGKETPGRVSDDASPCGNYCNSHIAISATGYGENFIDLAVLPKLGGLLEYGIPIPKAIMFIEKWFNVKKGQGGWIAITSNYEIHSFYNTKNMRYYGENSAGKRLFS
ncbi:isoaspartyl peptidase/L-asparaginase [Candidatus Riflebacteria bacterium]